MAILLNPWAKPERWLDVFRELLPDLPIHLWPDIPKPEEIRYAIVGDHPAEDLRRYPALRAILALSAGVEHLVGPAVPDVPLVRLHDEHMSTEMAAWVVHWVVHFHRGFDRYADQQQRAIWQVHRPGRANHHPVGILGYGAIGRRIGEVLADLEYPINAWVRTERKIDGVEVHAGLGGLDAFLGASSFVVNLLPDTPETARLMDESRFSAMRDGSVYLSLGRGATTDHAALIRALDSGPLRAAVLDVTDPEPLPTDSPLWAHPAVRITPHVSGPTNVRTAAAAVAENVLRMERGEPPRPVVDRRHRY